MRVLISGASGLIGQALTKSLRADGHCVLHLVRNAPQNEYEVRWDPSAGTYDAQPLTDLDVAVNLNGAGVGDRRWSAEYKQLLRSSRLDSTTTLFQLLADLKQKPRLVLQGSAVGFYGSRGDEVLTERSDRGEGFLADLTVDWEHAAADTDDSKPHGIDVAYLRTGLVMAAHGGAFQRLMIPFKLGVGGPVGDGQMWWPWITLHDHVRACRFLIDQHVTGPINLAGPEAARNKDVSHALGRALVRPSYLPVPEFALKTVLGEFAADVMASQRVEPAVLLDAGFAFDHPTIVSACRWLADIA